MQSRQRGRDNVETNAQNSPKANLLDLIRRTQEQMGIMREPRVESSNTNNLQKFNNNNVSVKKVNSISNNNINTVPKTKEDIDKIVSEASKVKPVESKFDNIKNFNNQAYSSNQQFKNVENAKKISSTRDINKAIKLIEAKQIAKNLEEEASKSGDYYNVYKNYADKKIGQLAENVDNATNLSGAMANFKLGVKKRCNKYYW